MTQGEQRPVRVETVEWLEQGPLFATRHYESGLEYLRGMVSGEVVRPPVAQALGIEVVAADPGRVRFTMPVKAFLINHLGVLAGGAIATVIDSALGCAALCGATVDQDIATIDLKVEFLRPVRADAGPVTADAELVHLGRGRALATCRVTDAAGRLCAVGSGNCLIRPKAGNVPGK